MFRLSLAIYLIIIFHVLSCTKKTLPEPISNTPKIKYIEASPLFIKEHKDTLILKIGHIDGDGDLGEDSTEKENLFINDDRIGSEFTRGFRFSRIKPGENPSPITGNLILKIPNILITDSSSSQNFRLSAYIVDRKGNKSDEIQTSIITINK